MKINQNKKISFLIGVSAIAFGVGFFIDNAKAYSCTGTNDITCTFAPGENTTINIPVGSTNVTATVLGAGGGGGDDNGWWYGDYGAGGGASWVVNGSKYAAAGGGAGGSNGSDNGEDGNSYLSASGGDGSYWDSPQRDGHPGFSGITVLSSGQDGASGGDSSNYWDNNDNNGIGFGGNGGRIVANFGSTTGVYAVMTGTGGFGVNDYQPWGPSGAGGSVVITYTYYAGPGACGTNNGTIAKVSDLNLCSIGTPSAVSGIGSVSWTCTGSSVANCSATVSTFAISSSAPAGNGTINCSSPVNSGASSTCTITPNANYVLSALTDNGTNVFGLVSSNQYVISNVSAPHALVATFVPTLNVTVTQAANGNITYGGSTAPNPTVVATGISPQFFVVPNTNYKIASVTVDGVAQTITNSQSFNYTFTNISTTHTIAATYALLVIPGVPTSVTATSNENAQSTVAWTAPATGDSPASYIITPYIGASAQSTTTVIGIGGNPPLTTRVVTGLTNGTSYTFTVKAVNGAGTSAASTASTAVIPATVPGAPTGLAAIASNGQATVSFSAPASNGGNAITGYTVTSIPAGGTDTNAGSTSLSHVVTGLTNGTSYTFTVTATNALGTSSPSTAGPAGGVIPTLKVTATVSAGANGTISPTGTVNNVIAGTTFTVTPSAGYVASMSGTCDGTLTGTTYTINSVSTNCTIVANFGIASSTYVSTIQSFSGVSSPSYGTMSWAQGFSGSSYASSSIASVISTGANTNMGIIFDKYDNLYVVDGSNIKKRTVAGVLSTIAGPGGTLFAVAVDADGNIYATTTSSVSKYTISNTTWNNLLTGASTLRGIAVDSIGNVYVASSSDVNNKIRKMSISNSQWTVIGSSATPGVNFDPNNIAVDSGDNLYVANGGNILKYTISSSTWSVQSTGFTNAIGVAVDSNAIVYVADVGGGQIKKNGVLVSSIVNVNNVAINSSGDIYYITSFGTNVGVLSTGTAIKMLVRSGNATMAGAHAWTDACNVVNGSNIGGGVNPCVNDGDQYVQYQAVMATNSGTNVPMLSNVSISTKVGYSKSFLSLLSSPYNTTNPFNSVQKITWTASNDTPATQGTVNFQIRTSADNVTWGQWCGPTTCGTANAYAADYYTDKTGATAINSTQRDYNSDQWIQYATFLKSFDGSLTPTLSNVSLQYAYNVPPAIVTNIATFQDGTGKAAIPYTITETYDDQGNIQHGTAASPIKVGLFYQPDSNAGVSNIKLKAALTNVATDTITILNPNNKPIPTTGSVLIDNELIEYTGGVTTSAAGESTITIKATGGTGTGGIGRGALFVTSYPTTAAAHVINSDVFFLANPALQTVNTLTGTCTPVSTCAGTQATLSGNSFTWDPRNDANSNLNLQKLTAAVFKVVANDADSLNFNTIGQSAPTSIQTLDLQASTISSVTTATISGSYKAGTTIPLTVTFSEPINFDATGGKTITLNLNSGVCTISSSITSLATATCSYNVGATDNTAVATYLRVNSITTTGVIKDNFSNQQSDFTISIAQNIDQNNTKQIIIDSIAPSLTNVTPGDSGFVNDLSSINSSIAYTVADQNAPLAVGSKIVFTRAGGAADATVHTCTLTGTALNAGAHNNFKLVNGANNCAEASNTLTLVTDAIYKMEITTFDLAGNNTVATSNGITFDITNPQLSFATQVDDVDSGPVQLDNVKVFQNETNPKDLTDASYKYQIVDASTNCSAQNDNTYTTKYTPGTDTTFNTEANNTKYLCFIAIDKAGNKGYLKSSKPFNIDTTKPAITITNAQSSDPAQATTFNLSLNDINLRSSSDTTAYQYAFALQKTDCQNQNIYDGLKLYTPTVTGSSAAASITVNVEDANNYKYVCFMAKDKADNIQNIASSYSLNIDRTNPEISFVTDKDIATTTPVQATQIAIYAHDKNLRDKKIAYVDSTNECNNSANFVDDFTPSIDPSDVNPSESLITYNTEDAKFNHKYVCAKAVDSAGNISSIIVSANPLNIDITKATLTKFDATMITGTTPDFTYGTGAQIDIKAVYNEPLQAGSQIKVKLNTINNLEVTLDYDANTPNILHKVITVDGPRKGYDTSSNKLNVISITSQNAIDIAGNIQNGTDVNILPSGNLQDNQEIYIDTGTAMLMSFSAKQGAINQGSFKEGTNITITATYSKNIKAGSNSLIKVKLNVPGTDQTPVTLSNVSGFNISGTYQVEAGDNIENLKVTEITEQDAVDPKGNHLTENGLLNSYNAKIRANDVTAPDVINITDGMMLDTTSPANTEISINGGAIKANDKYVTVRFKATDNFYAQKGFQVQFSNGNNKWCDQNKNLNQKTTFSDNIIGGYMEINNWDILNTTCGGPSDNELADTPSLDIPVSVKFFDGAGNETIASGTINYDKIPPVISAIDATYDPNKVYGPTEQIPFTITFNEALMRESNKLPETTTVPASTATIYFKRGNTNEVAGHVDLVQIPQNEIDQMATPEEKALVEKQLKGIYTIGATGSLEDSQKLTIDHIELTNVFDIPGNQPTDNTYNTQKDNVSHQANGIIVDTSVPTVAIRIDRSTGEYTQRVDLGIIDANGYANMSGKLQLLDDQSKTCDFQAGTGSVVINLPDQTYLPEIQKDNSIDLPDNTTPSKKACVILTDQANNAIQIQDALSAVAPQTPQNFAVTDISNKNINFYGAFLTWKKPETKGTGDFKSYQIFYCATSNSLTCDPNTYVTEITGNYNSNYYTYSGVLSPASNYCYRVKFRDGNGLGGDFSKFSSTQCAVPGEGTHLADSQVDIRNSDGDINIFDISKSTAKISFRTYNATTDSPIPAKARVYVYQTYKEKDANGLDIADPELRLQDPVLPNDGYFTDSETPTSPDHVIPLSGLPADKQLYIKIQVIDPFIESNVKKIIYSTSINSNLSFWTLGQLSKIFEISDPPTLLSDTNVIIDFKTDQNANCQIYYGPTSAVNQTTHEVNPDAYLPLPVIETPGEYIRTHSMQIGSLLAKTAYYYRISCQDNAPKNMTTVYSFDQSTIEAKTAFEGKFQTLDQQMGEADFLGRLDGVAPTISNISLSNVTGESATITWDTNEVSNSSVAYEVNGAGFSMMVGDNIVNADRAKFSTSHSVTMTNLIPATKYAFNVVSYDLSGNIGQSSQSTFTTKEPSSLSSIKVVSIALGQATVTWTTGSATTSTVEYGLTTAYGQSKQDSSSVKDHSLTLTDLTPGSTYHFRVMGEDSTKNMFASTDMTFQPKAPPVISGFKVDSINEHGAVASFSTNVPTDALVTYSNVDNADDSGVQGNPVMTNIHSVNLKNLTSGATFSVKVKVKDTDGNETEETFTNFTTTKDENPPKIDMVKTDTALTQNDKVQAIISWSTDEQATGRIVYKEGKAGEEKTYVVNDSPTFSHIGVVTSFKPGTVYYFKVKSTDIANNEATSTDFAVLTPKKRQNIIQIIIGNFTDIFGWAKF